MTMNQQLASLYGTPGAQSEDLTKVAEAELFTKLAAENGINVDDLTDEQVQYLWDETFGTKTAGEEPPAEEAKKEDEDEKEDEEKKEAAAREHAVKLAHAQEEAHAHYLGQVMAHSYVAELSKIAAAREASEAEAGGDGEDKTASGLGKAMAVRDAVKGGAGKAKDVITGKNWRGMGKTVSGSPLDNFKKKEIAKTVGAGAAAAGAAVGAGAGAKKAFGKKKESSALDALAMEHAVKIAADANFDVEEAVARIEAVATLGLGESTKVASTLPEQTHIRALEFLEAAGYPVQWDEPAQA
jgi:hypothetical protein